MLEPQKILAAMIVIDQGRTCLIKGRFFLMAVPAQGFTIRVLANSLDVSANIEFERISTARALRRGDKPQSGPAIGTDRMGGIGNFPTSATARWQNGSQPDLQHIADHTANLR